MKERGKVKDLIYDNSSEHSVGSLIKIIETLRGENGCKWDKKQTPSSISVYLTEEAFELKDAVDSKDSAHIQEEIGDVLFQLLTLIKMFEEKKKFSLKDVCNKTAEKMIRRHPHVFGEEKAESTEEIIALWHKIKEKEAVSDKKGSILDSVPKSIPALLRAYRVSFRAAAAGFDWDELSQTLEKLGEEIEEFKAEVEKGYRDSACLEIGDMFFTLVNIARFYGVHPETATLQSVMKFEKRFKKMEQQAIAMGKEIKSIGKNELNLMWEKAKKE